MFSWVPGTDPYRDRLFPPPDRKLLRKKHNKPVPLNGGLPLAGLPLELTVRIRELLEPVDIIKCSLVSRDWRRHIYRPDSLYHLAITHETHPIEGSARDPFPVSEDDIRRWQRQDSGGPTSEELQARLQHIPSLVIAHQLGLPASVLPLATDAKPARWTVLRPRLIRQYLLRLITDNQIEVIDLAKNIAFYPPCNDRPVTAYTLTTELYAHACPDGFSARDSIFIGRLTAPDLPARTLVWNEEVKDPDYGQPIFDGSILALAGESGTIVAIRRMACDGIDGYGFLILRSDDNFEHQEVRFFESSTTGNMYAAHVANNRCQLFIASQELGSEQTDLEIITISTDSPPRHDVTMGEYITCPRPGIELLHSATGYEGELLIEFENNAVLIGGPDDENPCYDLPSGSAMWKGRCYRMDDRMLLSTPARGIGPCTGTHVASHKCTEQSSIVINDTFLVVHHLNGSRGAACGASYHAYCFDRGMQLGSSDRRVMASAILDRKYEASASDWVRLWDM